MGPGKLTWRPSARPGIEGVGSVQGGRAKTASSEESDVISQDRKRRRRRKFAGEENELSF